MAVYQKRCGMPGCRNTVPPYTGKGQPRKYCYFCRPPLGQVKNRPELTVVNDQGKIDAPAAEIEQPPAPAAELSPKSVAGLPDVPCLEQMVKTELGKLGVLRTAMGELARQQAWALDRRITGVGFGTLPAQVTAFQKTYEAAVRGAKNNRAGSVLDELRAARSERRTGAS